MPTQLWIVYALLGALFAGVVQVMSKPAGDRIGPNPINFIRAVVMFLFFAGVLVYMRLSTHKLITPKLDEHGHNVSGISLRTALLLAIGGGVASSLSWLFGYQALRLSAVANSYSLDKLSLVFGVILAIVFLGERPSVPNYIGIVLMTGGAYLVTLKPVH